MSEPVTPGVAHTEVDLLSKKSKPRMPGKKQTKNRSSVKIQVPFTFPCVWNALLYLSTSTYLPIYLTLLTTYTFALSPFPPPALLFLLLLAAAATAAAPAAAAPVTAAARPSDRWRFMCDAAVACSTTSPQPKTGQA